MYSFEKRREVEGLIKKGIKIEQISEQTGIEEITLYEWKKEYELKQYIKELIKQGRFDEAYKEFEKFNTRYGKEYIVLGLRSKIAKEQGDIATEKSLLEQQLEMNPNDVKVMSSLIRIAKEQEDTEERKRLLNRQLEIESNNVITINNLIRIAREEGNIKERKRLLRRRLEIEPNNIKAINSLIGIARQEGNKKQEKRLLKKLLEIEPNNENAMKRLIKISPRKRKMWRR